MKWLYLGKFLRRNFDAMALSHCLYMDLDGQKVSHFKFTIPGFQKIYTNPIFFNPVRASLENPFCCTLADLNHEFDGPWDIFTKDLINGSFIMLQNNAFSNIFF